MILGRKRRMTKMIRMMVIIMVAGMTTTPAMMANYPVGMTHRITEDVECCAAEARRVDTRHRIRTPVKWYFRFRMGSATPGPTKNGNCTNPYH